MSKHGLKGKAAKNLSLITEFITTQYYFMWFEIKCKPGLVNGPRHVFRMIRLLEDHAPRRVKEIVVPVVNRGAWHAHSENLLLSLLASEDKEERDLAVDVIVKLRQGKNTGDKSVRQFRVPELNWKAEKVTELISWSDPSQLVFEPVLSCDLSLSELEELRDTPLNVDEYHCHGQAMERGVKEVTAASSKVYGFERRDGYIRARLQSRNLVPKPKSKTAMAGMVV